jgi:hypothetical protein
MKMNFVRPNPNCDGKKWKERWRTNSGSEELETNKSLIWKKLMKSNERAAESKKESAVKNLTSYGKKENDLWTQTKRFGRKGKFWAMTGRSVRNERGTDEQEEVGAEQRLAYANSPVKVVGKKVAIGESGQKEVERKKEQSSKWGELCEFRQSRNQFGSPKMKNKRLQVWQTTKRSTNDKEMRRSTMITQLVRTAVVNRVESKRNKSKCNQNDQNLHESLEWLCAFIRVQTFAADKLIRVVASKQLMWSCRINPSKCTLHWSDWIVNAEQIANALQQNKIFGLNESRAQKRWWSQEIVGLRGAKCRLHTDEWKKVRYKLTDADLGKQPTTKQLGPKLAQVQSVAQMKRVLEGKAGQQLNDQTRFQLHQFERNGNCNGGAINGWKSSCFVACKHDHIQCGFENA